MSITMRSVKRFRDSRSQNFDRTVVIGLKGLTLISREAEMVRKFVEDVATISSNFFDIQSLMKLRNEEERQKSNAMRFSEKRARKPKSRMIPSLRTREEFIRNRMDGLSFGDGSPSQ